MQLAGCRIIHVQQLVLPLAFLSIKAFRACDGTLHLTGIVDVDAGLPGECLGDDRGLTAAVVLETEVVRAAEG